LISAFLLLCDVTGDGKSGVEVLAEGRLASPPLSPFLAFFSMRLGLSLPGTLGACDDDRELTTACPSQGAAGGQVGEMRVLPSFEEIS
jgi:hypothetical protein